MTTPKDEERRSDFVPLRARTSKQRLSHKAQENSILANNLKANRTVDDLELV